MPANPAPCSKRCVAAAPFTARIRRTWPARPPASGATRAGCAGFSQIVLVRNLSAPQWKLRLAVTEPKPTTYLAHLRHWAPEEILEAEKAINDLVQTPGWEIVQRLLAAERTAILHRLELRLTSYEEMARQTGGLAGLRGADEATRAVLIAAGQASEKLQQALAPASMEA